MKAKIEPMWVEGVPLCDRGCASHDGKRCEVIGHRPDRLCQPAVVQMANVVGAAQDAAEDKVRGTNEPRYPELTAAYDALYGPQLEFDGEEQES